MYKRIFNIVNLIVKERLHLLSKEEKRIMSDWIDESEKHNEFYKKVIDSQNIASRFSFYHKIDEQKSWTDLYQKISKHSRKLLLRNISRWAAVLLIPLVITYVFIDHKNATKYQRFIERNVDFESKAVLILDNNKKIDLEKVGSIELNLYEQVTTKNNNNQLEYKLPDKHNLSLEPREIMNTVRTSVNVNGGYSIRLSDGTKVILNCGTQLKYPIQFIGAERTVYLSGEALFEVAENAEKPFFVVTDNIKVEVVGTVFNIKTDNQKHIAQTTLLNGSVRVNTSNAFVMLEPGQQAYIGKDNELNVRNVNTTFFTSWIKGVYTFNDMKLLEISDLIQSWYNVDVFYENESCKYIRFTGAMNKNEPIDRFIELIEKTSSVKFSIAENALVISK